VIEAEREGQDMAEIKGFNGIRYNRQKIKEFADVITQPYDQITDEMEKAYKKQSPYSYVNLVLTHYADGHDRLQEYEAAKKYVDEWTKNKIFVQDEKPSIYPYFQEFMVDGKKYVRKGFICIVRLEELGKGSILPHEKTLSKPKEDRLSLTRKTKKDFEPVFMLYTDPRNQVMELIEKECKQPPLINVVGDYKVTHKFWQISSTDTITKISSYLKTSTFVIADGHHRYETFFNYRNELEDVTNEHPANFKMITLVNIQDPGLVILPTHRLIMNLPDFDLDAFIRKTEEFFTAKKCDKQRINEDLAAEKFQAFGFHSLKGTFLLKLKTPKIMGELLVDKSQDYQGLDVAVLHTLLIERILGIKPEQVEDHIRYQRGINETMKRVDAGEFQFCFLMNPTRPEQVKEVATKHERMPQKSTDFYPKLISGLVFYDIA